jgi:hypothetical protein
VNSRIWHLTGTPMEPGYYSSESEMVSYGRSGHHYWNGDDVIVMKRDHSIAGDARHCDSAPCPSTETSLGNDSEVRRTVGA